MKRIDFNIALDIYADIITQHKYEEDYLNEVRDFLFRACGNDAETKEITTEIKEEKQNSFDRFYLVYSYWGRHAESLVGIFTDFESAKVIMIEELESYLQDLINDGENDDANNVSDVLDELRELTEDSKIWKDNNCFYMTETKTSYNWAIGTDELNKRIESWDF